MTRTVVHREVLPDGYWLMAERAAAPALHRLVQRYIGYEESTRTPIRRVEVPHPNVTLILNLGAPLRVHAPALTREPPAFRSFVAGLWDTVAMTENTGPSAGIELNLSPLGAWQLFGVPMTHLMNRVVHLGDLPRGLDPWLEEQLRALDDWDARFDLLDASLTRKMNAAPDIPPAVQWAWERMTAMPAADTRVGSIGRELGWSRRRLGAAFREYVGLTPKSAARVMRFDRAVSSLRRGWAGTLSTLACECGYADQAHLTREFREFAGITPGEMLRRRTDGAVAIHVE